MKVCAIARNAAAAHSHDDDVVDAAGAHAAARAAIDLRRSSARRSRSTQQRRQRAGARRRARSSKRRTRRARRLHLAVRRRRPPGRRRRPSSPSRRASSSPTFFRSAISLRRRRHDLHALFVELLRCTSRSSPALSFQPRASASAAAFSTASCVGLSSASNACLVDEHRVLRQPGLGVVPVLDVLVGLACRSRSSPTTCSSRRRRWPAPATARRPGSCTGCAPTSSAILRGGRAVGAPLEALHVGHRVDRLLGVDALRRPRHRVQQHHALRAEQLVERRLLRRRTSFFDVGVAGGEERQAVGAEERVLVLEVDQQDLADLRLAALHRALDLVAP